MAAAHSRLAVGRTPIGLQVWCYIHNTVAHFAYPEDMKPLVNMDDAPRWRSITKRSWWW